MPQLTTAEPSPAQRLLRLNRTDRRRMLAGLSEAEQVQLHRDWRFWARPQQLEPPGSWVLWWIITGRGWGKTRTGAEWCIDRCEAFARHGAVHRGGLMGKTAADARDVMIEGESGIVAVCERRGHRCKYEPSKRRVTLPDLGSVFTAYTAEKPDQVRGHQWHTFWGDEPAAWKQLADREGNTAWSNAMLALRLEGMPADASWVYDDPDGEEDDVEADLGELPPAPPELQPRGVATTTPKPIALIIDAVKRANSGDDSVVLTQGSLYDNVAHLAPRFVAEVTARYADSRMGGQEIHGLVLESVEGALWTPYLIGRDRVSQRSKVPQLAHVVVAIDPSGSTGGDEAGIVVVGIEAHPVNPLLRHVYVLDDLTQPGRRPEAWARVAVDEYWRWVAKGVPCTIVAEVNFGAAMVEDVVRLVDSNVRFDEVRASKGKRQRAEPVATVYDQGRAHHVGTFGQMEAEQCTWVPDEGMDSPNRLDAVVWGISYLLPEITTRPPSSGTAADIRIPTGAEGFSRGHAA